MPHEKQAIIKEPNRRKEIWSFMLEILHIFSGKIMVKPYAINKKEIKRIAVREK